MPKSYKELCEQIAELHRQVNALYDRIEYEGDPTNDLAASIDELDDEIDDLVAERDALIHASLGF